MSASLRIDITDLPALRLLVVELGGLYQELLLTSPAAADRLGRILERFAGHLTD